MHTYCIEKFGEFGNVVPPTRAGHLEIHNENDYNESNMYISLTGLNITRLIEICTHSQGHRAVGIVNWLTF